MERKKWWIECLYILLITCLFFLVYGYKVNTSDHEEHLPQVYKILDPSLYPNDFFIRHFEQQSHTIRDFYILVVAGLAKIFPISAVLFGLNFICIFFTVYAFFFLTKEFSKNEIAPYLAMIVVFFITLKFPVGGNHLQYPMLVCSTLAKAFASLALLMFVRKKYWVTFLLLGIASLFQVLVGLQLFVIVVLLYCFIVKGDWWKLGGYMILYLITSAFILYPVINQYLQKTTVNSELFHTVLFDIRNPEHYRLEATPVKHLLAFAFLYIIGFFLLLRSEIAHKRMLILFTIIVTCFCIFQYISIEIKSLNFLVPAQWYKTTIWITAFFSCIVTIYFCDMVENRRQETGDLKSVFNFQPSTFNYSLITLSGLCVIILFFSKSMHYKKSDLTLMHEWIKENTPKDAVIMSFPSDDSFLCEAQRSMPVEFRAMIHNPEYQEDWLNETNRLYHSDLLNNQRPMLDYLDDLYNSDENIPYESSVPVQYKLIDKSGFEATVRGKIIYEEGNYTLIKIDGN